MNARALAILAVLAVVAAASPIGAQTFTPKSEAEVGKWDAAIVRRAAAMIASPEQWDRADSTSCRVKAKAFSLGCALKLAIDAQAGVAPSATPAGPVRCELHRVGSRNEGTCGLLFDELSIFSVAKANAVTTGKWRGDSAPTEVWFGRMTDAGSPVLDEARKLIDIVSREKYHTARLVEYNGDSTVTYAGLQQFFRTLEDRVSKLTPETVSRSAEDVEIEIHGRGAGVIRTYNGWYAVSGFSASDSTIRFQIDTLAQIPANALDREVIERANTLLASDAVWNRADNRKCPATATTWSIYCALEKATRDVTGGFHHRRPALELVRVIVEERTKGRDYHHRLMDYNNDPSTHLNDVRTLFAEALARVK